MCLNMTLKEALLYLPGHSFNWWMLTVQRSSRFEAMKTFTFDPSKSARSASFHFGSRCLASSFWFCLEPLWKGTSIFEFKSPSPRGGALLSQIEQVERSIADPPSWNSLCRNQLPQMLRSANISQVNCETDGLHVIYGKRCSTCFSLMGLLWRQKTCHIVQKFIRKMTSQLIITSVNIAAFLRWRTFLSRNWAADTQSHTTPQNAVQMC